MRLTGRINPITNFSLLTDLSAQDLPKGTATFVTSLYDIGRETWPKFSRSFSSYLQRFKHLLALDINLVIFGENSLKPFVKKYRKQLTSKTRFLTKPFIHLPAYKHKHRIECVLDSESFKKDNGKLGHPEAFSAEYLIVVNSKVPLVGEVVRRNPFNTTHFFWVDAGYVAVSDDTGYDVMRVIIPAGTQWRPDPLLSSSEKVTYIQLHDPDLYANMTQLHKQRLAPAVSGGFFGGAQKVMSYYARLYNKCLLYQLAEGEVGEDQGVALQAYFEHPRVFHLVKGDWFDAYRLFH